jgi:hypothetical protein
LLAYLRMPIYRLLGIGRSFSHTGRDGPNTVV